MQRRVRQILDVYCSKAPPAEQWPPGRRIRVRGVDIHYKVISLYVLYRIRLSHGGTGRDRKGVRYRAFMCVGVCVFFIGVRSTIP